MQLRGRGYCIAQNRTLRSKFGHQRPFDSARNYATSSFCWPYCCLEILSFKICPLGRSNRAQHIKLIGTGSLDIWPGSNPDSNKPNKQHSACCMWGSHACAGWLLASPAVVASTTTSSTCATVELPSPSFTRLLYLICQVLYWAQKMANKPNYLTYKTWGWHGRLL